MDVSSIFYLLYLHILRFYLSFAMFPGRLRWANLQPSKATYQLVKRNTFSQLEPIGKGVSQISLICKFQVQQFRSLIITIGLTNEHFMITISIQDRVRAESGVKTSLLVAIVHLAACFYV